MEVTYLDHMGNDLTVVNAARVSFHKESKEFTFRKDIEKGSDEGLVEYLAKHGHWTPFSQPQIQMREKVPIFVARQRFKHMVGFTYNEVSRRYVDDAPEFFTPTSWRGKPLNAKQGSSEDTIEMCWWRTAENYYPINDRYYEFTKHAQELYEDMLNGGVAPEQARMVLPQSMYTEYVVTGSLAAWARAYKQRIDSHAQKEIQELAKEWDKIITPIFPVCWKMLTT